MLIFVYFLTLCRACFRSERLEEITDTVPFLSCDRHRRIIGGKTAEENSWPWLVQILSLSEKRWIYWTLWLLCLPTLLLYSGKTGFCGGTILSDTKILTAAHCFESAEVSTSKSGHHTVAKMDLLKKQNTLKRKYLLEFWMFDTKIAVSTHI